MSNYTHCAIYIIFCLLWSALYRLPESSWGWTVLWWRRRTWWRRRWCPALGSPCWGTWCPVCPSPGTGTSRCPRELQQRGEAAPVNWFALEKRLGEISQPYLGSERSNKRITKHWVQNTDSGRDARRVSNVAWNARDKPMLVRAGCFSFSQCTHAINRVVHNQTFLPKYL